jgi:hypothetical protein
MVNGGWHRWVEGGVWITKRAKAGERRERSGLEEGFWRVGRARGATGWGDHAGSPLHGPPPTRVRKPKGERRPVHPQGCGQRETQRRKGAEGQRWRRDCGHAEEGKGAEGWRSLRHATRGTYEGRIRCNRPTCNTCPHGPYLYAILRSDGQRRDTSLGPNPTAATFYRKLAEHLPGEQIRNLIRQRKEEQP